jgi:hypothetical protein
VSFVSYRFDESVCKISQNDIRQDNKDRDTNVYKRRPQSRVMEIRADSLIERAIRFVWWLTFLCLIHTKALQMTRVRLNFAQKLSFLVDGVVLQGVWLKSVSELVIEVVAVGFRRKHIGDVHLPFGSNVDNEERDS